MSVYYVSQLDDTYSARVKEYSSALPPFMSGLDDYLLEHYKAYTAVRYIRALVFFLKWNKDHDKRFDFDICELEPSHLGMISQDDVIVFYNYISRYGSIHKDELDFMIENGKSISSKVHAIKVYDLALTSVFKYFIERKFVDSNPFVNALSGFEFPEQEKFVLTEEMLEKLLDVVQTGNSLSPRQLIYYERTWHRDYAICCLLAGTGIRPYELCTLDVEDIRFDTDEVHVASLKNEMIHERVYHLDPISREALKTYLEYREDFCPISFERALFLSCRKNQKAPSGSRLKEKAVENMLHKYARAALPNCYEKVTPSKLSDYLPVDQSTS